MATWRVELGDPLRVYRDDEPLHLRTRHQTLLLLRMIAFRGKGVDRSETAAMLWPESDRSLQFAYLRRAIMELRRADLEIETQGERVGLAEAVVAELSIDPGDAPDGFEHPIVSEARASRRRLATQETKAIMPTDADRLMAWIGETLIREHPEVALDMLARHGWELARSSPPAPVLRLLLQALAAGSRLSASRVAVTRHAGVVAILLTKYGLAERLLSQTLEDARALGDDALLANSLSVLAFLHMERRRWPEAVSMGRLAAEAAVRSGNPLTTASSYNNLAGIQWHMGGFEEAAANYALSYRASEDEGQRLNALANAVFIWGVYGTPIWTTVAAPPPPSAHGLTSTSQTFMLVGYGMRRGIPDLVAQGASRMLRTTGDDGLERLFCVALDCAAYAFARLQRRTEAAACVRMGSRLRLAIGHHRSPAETLAIRRHVAGPFFGKRIGETVAAFGLGDLAVCGERIAARLEAAL